MPSAGRRTPSGRANGLARPIQIRPRAGSMRVTTPVSRSSPVDGGTGLVEGRLRALERRQDVLQPVGVQVQGERPLLAWPDVAVPGRAGGPVAGERVGLEGGDERGGLGRELADARDLVAQVLRVAARVAPADALGERGQVRTGVAQGRGGRWRARAPRRAPPAAPSRSRARARACRARRGRAGVAEQPRARTGPTCTRGQRSGGASSTSGSGGSGNGAGSVPGRARRRRALLDRPGPARGVRVGARVPRAFAGRDGEQVRPGGDGVRRRRRARRRALRRRASSSGWLARWSSKVKVAAVSVVTRAGPAVMVTSSAALRAPAPWADGASARSAPAASSTPRR